MGNKEEYIQLFFKKYIQVAARELGEEALYSSTKHALGIVITTSLKFALGSVGLVVPVAEIVAFTAIVGVKAAMELARSGPSGTAYDVIPHSGFLEVNRTRTIYKERFPFPENLTIPVDNIFRSQQAASTENPFRLPDAQLIDAREVYSFSGLFSNVCEECGISYGHSFNCSRNRDLTVGGIITRRSILTGEEYQVFSTGGSICEECNSILPNHLAGCSKNPQLHPFTHIDWNDVIHPVCDECKSILPNHTTGCSKNPKVQQFTPVELTPTVYSLAPVCDECNSILPNHAAGCSKNPIVQHFTPVEWTPTIYPLAPVCDECKSILPNHAAGCSKNPLFTPVEWNALINPPTPLVCDECNMILPDHKFGCSKSGLEKLSQIKINMCPFCHGLFGSHQSWCSFYEES